MEQGSDVARSRQQIGLELEAARNALHGFAIISRHDFINARMQRGGEHILHLMKQGRHEEAQALLNTGDWGARRQPTSQHSRRTQTRKKGKRKGEKG